MFNDQSQQFVTIKLQIEGLQLQEIKLEIVSQLELLLDYEAFCKKVLQTFRFVATGKNVIRLSITNFYGIRVSVPIPIYHPKNWTTMIADMIERNINIIQVEVTKQQELRQKKKRKLQDQVQFDSDGSIESVEDNTIREAIKANTPSQEPYRGEEIVRCVFCLITNRQKEGTRASGPFYGPFKGNTYAHLLCLLWCSSVFLNSNLQICGVEKALQTSKSTTCNYCKQKGAIYCHAESCHKRAHYKCAAKNSWFFNWTAYQAYCPQDIPDPVISNTSSRTRTITNKESSSNKIEQLIK